MSFDFFCCFQKQSGTENVYEESGESDKEIKSGEMESDAAEESRAAEESGKDMVSGEAMYSDAADESGAGNESVAAVESGKEMELMETDLKNLIHPSSMESKADQGDLVDLDDVADIEEQESKSSGAEDIGSDPAQQVGWFCVQIVF